MPTTAETHNALVARTRAGCPMAASQLVARRMASVFGFGGDKAPPVAPAAEPPAATLNARIRQAITEDPSRMTLQIARDLGCPELAVITALPADRCVELDASRWEPIIRSFEALGRVHVIVSNGAVTIEAFGEFGNFSTWQNFFNVQSKSLDMHIRADQLARCFAVTKPSHMDGRKTLSVQFFDPCGNAAMKVFLNFGEAVEEQREAYFARLIGQHALGAANAGQTCAAR